MSQEELARRVNCGFETIRKIETGQRRPSREMALLLAQALKVPPEEQTAFVEFARAPADTAAAAGVAAAGLAARPPVSQLANLPPQRTAFFGRAHELALAGELLLNPAVRLLSLTGPPGVGKTRFGLRLAELVKTEFRDGAVFVSLAPLTDPGAVASAIVRGLGIVDSPATAPGEMLKAYLAGKQTLLVLDNFEHLLPAAPLLGDLVEACRDLKLLVTSTIKLGIYGEYQYSLPPLMLDDAQAVATKDGLVVSEAAAFFAQRARAVRPLFNITAANAPAVEYICRQLDGLPLAIELAAARISGLTPAALAAQLTRRLAVLTGGSREWPIRQHTLRTAIAWSYDLLNQAERSFFCRLGVFVGGLTLSAAAAIAWPAHAADSQQAPVTTPTANSGADVSALDMLQRLVDRSLLTPDEAGDEPRFHLLETLREFALERLAVEWEIEPVRRRHAEYFLALAEADELLVRERGASALEAEYDNLRAALDWAASPPGDALVGLRLAVSLRRWWVAHGYLIEGRQRMLAALARSAESDAPALRALGLSAAGDLAHRLGDLTAARSHLAASSALYERLGDKAGQALLHGQVAAVAQAQGDFAEARRCWLACCAWYEEAGDLAGRAAAINGLAGVAAAAGDYAQARALYTESMALHQRLGMWRRVTLGLLNMGALARIQGDFAAALALQTEALGQAQAQDDSWTTAGALCYLGELALTELDYPTARWRAEESVALFRAVQGYTPMLLYALGIQGLALSGLGEHSAALALLDERLALARRTGGSYLIAPALYDLGLAALRAADQQQASARLREALALFAAQGHHWGLVRCLAGLAMLAARQNRLALAGRLFGAAEALAQLNGAQLEPEARLARDHSRARAELQLPAGEWDAAYQTAGRTPPGEVLVLALAVAGEYHATLQDHRYAPAPVAAEH